MTDLDRRSRPAHPPERNRLTPTEFARQAETLRPRLRGVAQQILGNDPQLEDVVQDAIVHGLRALERFRHEAKLSTWMHRIVTNTALMHLRSRRRRPEQFLEELPCAKVELRPQNDHGERTPERQLLDRETIQSLTRALAIEPEFTRDLVALACVEERSHAEVAARLGLTKSAVKTRLFRARARLRASMDEHASASATESSLENVG